MDAYACIIFSQLHIKDFVIDIHVHVYDNYDIIPYTEHGYTISSPSEPKGSGEVINWPQKKKNLIHRKGEASILFDFFSFFGFWGASAPRPSLHLSYILCIMADNCFHFHSCVLISR